MKRYKHSATESRRPAGKAALTSAALILIALFSVWVRVPHISGTADGKLPANRIDKYGEPYFVELDAYYHVRMADEIVDNGRYGTYSEEHEGYWDGLRNYPVGRSAVYEDGMIWMDILWWRFLNIFGDIGLHRADFWFSALSAVFTVLVAFLLGSRAAPSVGASPAAAGLMAALLVSCAPAFAARTLCGTFDTDLVQTPVAALLMLLMTEMLRSDSHVRSIIFALLTGGLAAAFTKLWTISFAFTAIALAGGFIYVIGSLFGRVPQGQGRLRSWIKRPFIAGYLITLISTVACVSYMYGPGYIKSFLIRTTTVSNSTASASMPNMYGSVSELQNVTMLPSSANIMDWLMGGAAGSRAAVINGIGGILVAVMAAAGLLALIICLFRRKKDEEAGSAGRPGLYLSILAIWALVCVYALRMGVRFIEHLCAPVGILAALGAAAVAALLTRKKTDSDDSKARPGRIIAAAVLCAALILPSAIGAHRIYTVPHGLISDAHENAMDWIAANAETPDAVVASWWDLGYYYTYESKHPTLWDGGELNPLRAIVVGKALTTDDMELSRALFIMLANSGNSVPQTFIDKLGGTKGFEALYETVVLERDEAAKVLRDKYGFTAAEADEAADMMHPAETPEIYLVVTGRMMRILGWFEFYGNWDFEGENIKPADVSYNKTPDGSADMDTAEGEQKEFFEKRANETVWRLYFGMEEGPFTPVYETGDGIENVQVWKLVPVEAADASAGSTD